MPPLPNIVNEISLEIEEETWIILVIKKPQCSSILPLPNIGKWISLKIEDVLWIIF